MTNSKRLSTFSKKSISNKKSILSEKSKIFENDKIRKKSENNENIGEIEEKLKKNLKKKKKN